MEVESGAELRSARTGGASLDTPARRGDTGGMFVPNLHRTVLSTALVVSLLATGVASLVQGATPAVDSIEVVADIDYAGSGNPRQQLDLLRYGHCSDLSTILARTGFCRIYARLA